MSSYQSSVNSMLGSFTHASALVGGIKSGKFNKFFSRDDDEKADEAIELAGKARLAKVAQQTRILEAQKKFKQEQLLKPISTVGDAVDLEEDE